MPTSIFINKKYLRKYSHRDSNPELRFRKPPFFPVELWEREGTREVRYEVWHERAFIGLVRENFKVFIALKKAQDAEQDKLRLVKLRIKRISNLDLKRKLHQSNGIDSPFNPKANIFSQRAGIHRFLIRPHFARIIKHTAIESFRAKISPPLRFNDRKFKIKPTRHQPIIP